MWIVVPSTCCPSAPEPGDSISASDWRSRLLERSALWRSKPTPAKSWLRAWKKGGWMRRLFGRICEPSTAARGVASWISSLAATRASRSVSPANDSEQMTLDTCGLTSPAFFASARPLLHSLKTCVGTCLSACEKCAQSWKTWVTALTRRSSERRKSARPTAASESSSWPTPTALSYGTNQGGAAGRTGPVRPSLETMAKQWPTPNVPNGGRLNSRHEVESSGSTEKGKRQISLEASARYWSTPTARDWKDGACADSKAPTNALLGRQDLRTPMAGAPGLVLSPLFVEMLMGWPIGWSACDSAAMASSLNRPPLPLSSCGDER
jgi:hypothetical protein